MVKATDSTDSPSTERAAMEKLKAPLCVGVPVMAPVVALISSPDGRLVADQLVAGSAAASVSAGVIAGKTSPTLPVKLWPAVMMGAG